MANKIGLREVTIIGSVMASAFFIISSFSVNIDMMLVTYGIMGGSSFFMQTTLYQARTGCRCRFSLIYILGLYCTEEFKI